MGIELGCLGHKHPQHQRHEHDRWADVALERGVPPEPDQGGVNDQRVVAECGDVHGRGGPRIRIPHVRAAQAGQVGSDGSARLADALLQPLVWPVDAEARDDAGVRGVLELDFPPLRDEPAGDEPIIVSVQGPNPPTKDARRKVLIHEGSQEAAVGKNFCAEARGAPGNDRETSVGGVARTQF